MIVPRILNPRLFRASKFCDLDSRSPWRLMENVNKNMERMMEDVYNDMWSTRSPFGSAFNRGAKVSTAAHVISRWAHKSL